MDWWFNAATAPDAHGFFNMSYGTSNCNVYKQTAKKIVFEVRSDYPWAEGGRFNTIHIDDIDYWVEVDCEKYRWPQINERVIKARPEEEAVARGERITCVYHSHVEAGAYFSEMDQDFADQPLFPFPRAAHLVVAVVAGKVVDPAIFRREPGVARFVGRSVVHGA